MMEFLAIFMIEGALDLPLGGVQCMMVFLVVTVLLRVLD